jgi:hypothetical protein
VSKIFTPYDASTVAFTMLLPGEFNLAEPPADLDDVELAKIHTGGPEPFLQVASLPAHCVTILLLTLILAAYLSTATWAPDIFVSEAEHVAVPAGATTQALDLNISLCQFDGNQRYVSAAVTFLKHAGAPGSMLPISLSTTIAVLRDSKVMRRWRQYSKLQVYIPNAEPAGAAFLLASASVVGADSVQFLSHIHMDSTLVKLFQVEWQVSSAAVPGYLRLVAAAIGGHQLFLSALLVWSIGAARYWRFVEWVICAAGVGTLLAALSLLLEAGAGVALGLQHTLVQLAIAVQFDVMRTGNERPSKAVLTFFGVAFSLFFGLEALAVSRRVAILADSAAPTDRVTAAEHWRLCPIAFAAGLDSAYLLWALRTAKTVHLPTWVGVLAIVVVVNMTVVVCGGLLVLGSETLFSWTPVIAIFGADAWATAALAFLFHRTSKGIAAAIFAGPAEDGIKMDVDDGLESSGTAFAEVDDDP